MAFTISDNLLKGKQYYSKNISERERTHMLPSALVTQGCWAGGESGIINTIYQTYVFSKSPKLRMRVGTSSILQENGDLERLTVQDFQISPTPKLTLIVLSHSYSSRSWIQEMEDGLRGKITHYLSHLLSLRCPWQVEMKMSVGSDRTLTIEPQPT